jgi:RimJ/RimL family protein N-acetyltransferase
MKTDLARPSLPSNVLSQDNIMEHEQGASSLLKAALKRLGVRTARFRGRMEEPGLTVRLYRFRDLIALHSLCKPDLFLVASGVQLKAFSSLASFWTWIHTTFQVFYIIEVEEPITRTIIGFLGIYNMQLGKELWVSLVLFNATDRRQGYGSRALELFLSSLQRDQIIKRVCGEVLPSNTGSLRLLKKLGFDVFARHHDRLFLQKQLGHTISTAHS